MRAERTLPSTYYEELHEIEQMVSNGQLPTGAIEHWRGLYAEPDMRVCTLCGATGHTAAGCPWNRH